MSWEHAGICAPGSRLSVNLSARQLRDPGLVADVARVLLAVGMKPRQLQLEITETTAMDDNEETAETLRTLWSLGLRLAIDDFGAGFSAFSYLRHCPVDTLKIDRSFVAGLGRNPEDERIVEAVIAFSQSLGLDVVGEGIETEDQAARLRALGCGIGQGYLYSRPLPPSLLEAALILDRRAPERGASQERAETTAFGGGDSIPSLIEVNSSPAVRWTA